MTRRLTFSVCCRANEINDATFRYVEIIRRALVRAGYVDLGFSRNPRILRSSGLIVTISCTSAIWALICRPRGLLLHWFQGLEAVERRFLHAGWPGKMRYIVWGAMEQFLLRRANYRLYVSEEMQVFFEGPEPARHGTLVMPCYNSDFDEEAWGGSPDRYQELNLVYAGSLYAWQCVAESLSAFQALQQIRPDARLTIYTRETERAIALSSHFKINELEIASLPPSELIIALRKFSFGFLLREPMSINEVSTPTKFSSYLAAGVIPITTNATPAINKLTAGSPYRIVVDLPQDSRAIADAVLEMSEQAHSPDFIRRSYMGIFREHFNDEYYENAIIEMIGKNS